MGLRYAGLGVVEGDGEMMELTYFDCVLEEASEDPFIHEFDVVVASWEVEAIKLGEFL